MPRVRAVMGAGSKVGGSERINMTKNSQRINRSEFLTTSAQVAVWLAVSVLTSGHLVRPTYARTMKEIQTATPHAASNTTHAIPAATKPADMLQSQAWAKRFLSGPPAAAFTPACPADQP